MRSTSGKFLPILGTISTIQTRLIHRLSCVSRRRGDFPPNLSNLAIEHVVLYVVRKDGEVFEQSIRHLHFTEEGMTGAVGGLATTVSGRVSTRSGNGANWLPLIGQLPHGMWELAFQVSCLRRLRRETASQTSRSKTCYLFLPFPVRPLRFRNRNRGR